jgi:prephenate dehydrogenase
LEPLGTVAIVGVGLIGGSVGSALRARALARRVVGIGRNEARLAEGVRLGALDVATTELARGVSEADVVVVCTPVTQVADDVMRAAESSEEDVLITDAGSTKRTIVEAVERDPRSRAVFVGGHPIAGSEQKGVEYARPDLFQGRVCALTPTRQTPLDRLDRARRFWTSLGCRIVETSPDAHDAALALTSHLPHAVAAALAGTVPIAALTMAAGAYRDGTRVAKSDAALWAGIFRENRGPVLESLAAFQHQLGALIRALENDDDAAIRAWWEDARDRRTHYDALNQARNDNA